MKTITAILLFVICATDVIAQETMSCCQKLDATVEFAMLSNDAAFRNKHLDPIPFEHISEAGKMMEFKSTDGSTQRAFELKATESTSNYIFVFHEWYGLNDYVKKEAEKLYNELGNVHVIALDLYNGKVATNREDASKYMQAVDPKAAHAVIEGLSNHVGENAKIATIGWCFGGGWSLQAAIDLGSKTQGCIIYYGMPEKDVERLKTLKSDVLGIFASQEQWINTDVVNEFKDNMKAAGKKADIHSFDADHAFANPSNPKYDSEATKKAYELTVAYLKERLN